MTNENENTDVDTSNQGVHPETGARFKDLSQTMELVIAPIKVLRDIPQEAIHHFEKRG